MIISCRHDIHCAYTTFVERERGSHMLIFF
jgi:hypothetical protein